jgi:protein gp37
MASAPQHTFQVLTKRPERMREYMLVGPGRLPRPPLPNVWLGVSIENRKWVGRADVLRETPAAVRFISAEPLLGPLLPKIAGTEDEPIAWWPDGRDTPCVPYDGLDLLDIDWVIVGGESGPGHRPFDPEWARDLRDACGLLGVAFFVKQLGGARPGTALGDLPEDLRIRDFPAVPT